MNASCRNSTIGANVNVKWACEFEIAKSNSGQYDQLICYFIGMSVIVFCTIIGTLANSLSLRYFLTKSNIFFNAFQLTAVCDISICVLSVPYGLSFVAQRDPLMFQNHLCCKIWTLLWKLLTRASVHLVAVQSIMRAYVVCAPFRSVSRRIVLQALVFDMILFILPPLVIVLAAESKLEFSYVTSFASCMDIHLESDIKKVLGMGIFHHASLFLPFPFIIVSCILCCGNLIRLTSCRTTQYQHNSTSRRVKIHSMISIILLSVVCLVLNIPVLLTILYQVQRSKIEIPVTHTSDRLVTWMLLYGHSLARQVTVSINSLCNPFIYIWRMRDLRSYLQSATMRVVQIFSRSPEPTALIIEHVEMVERVDTHVAIASLAISETVYSRSSCPPTKSSVRCTTIEEEASKSSYDPVVIIHGGDPVSGTIAGKLRDVIGTIRADDDCVCELCFLSRHSVEVNQTERDKFTGIQCISV